MDSINSIKITNTLATYHHHLLTEEKSPTTITKYLRDLQKFLTYTADRPITKELVITYKEELKQQYATASINSMLASLNHYFDFAGLYDCKVKQIKQQRRVYCPEEKELSKEEYYRLIKAAQDLQKDRLSLIIQTICSTGIRISELECITVRAAQSGVAEVNCKGKSRQIFIPHKLKMMLLSYIKKQQIRQGPIFITKQGNPINRSNVWREMKNLCEIAQVRENKVFPHNLRHLFAKTYYKMEKDISKLADLLGHSSINTTRIYIISSGEEHRRQIDKMKLLL
ncbi:tyrosine-type recombinase/integrase [[Clostridium] symbiosum]|uniref:tyrosine-type recombinase/integrase n=1 Tax=Clostridium symbiosum TaxID=1512 RepID=UPI001D092C59|nr:tyrosine-type recombinase/integrase [[Clostridium] symbiosum]MCB6607722.1 site-specific integrase [[Clostridium] symbiosum]MCB6932583.1 site-specific integrase [[Clostridium] symbiosum]